MAMKPGEIVRTWTPEEQSKFIKASRILMANPPKRYRPGVPKAIRAHKRLAILAALLILVSGSSYAALSMTILVPHIPAHGILLNCLSAIPSKPSVLINTSGFLLVTCGGNGILKALSGTNATANYTLPSPYLDLYLYPAGQDSVITTKCTDAPAALSLARPVVFGYEGNWSFCADYATVGADGLPGFSVGWTVNS